MSYYGGGGGDTGRPGQNSGSYGDDWAPSQGGPQQGSRLVAVKGMLGGVKLATPGQRIASGLIDWTPAWIALVVFSNITTGTHVEQTCNAVLCYDQQTDSHGLAVLGWLLAMGWVIFNSIIIQGRTGQSMGKRVMKTRVVWPIESRGGDTMLAIMPGPGKCAGRAIINSAFLFFVFLPDVIVTFASQHYRSLGDMAAKTVVFGPDNTFSFDEDVDRSAAQSVL